MRLVGLDAARSVAIVMAMASHVWAHVSLGDHVPDDAAVVIRFFFQIATPTFILLFGTMLEVIYRPRWTDAGARRKVAIRLLSRAFQCWLLYSISIFALFLVDDGYSLRFSVATILFMGNSPYTEILKFYAVVLALAPLLLWARCRVGLVPLVILALAYHLAWPLLDALPDARQDLGAPLAMARLIKFVTGFGDLPMAGPSVLHGLTLVVAGQCLGWFLTPRSQAQGTAAVADRAFGQRIGALLAMSGTVVAIGLVALPEGSMNGLANMSLRMSSHPLYFAAGAASAALMASLFLWIIDVRGVGGRPVVTRLTFFGRTSMFTFAWGNILLYVVHPAPQGAAATALWAGLLLMAVAALSYGFDRAARNSSGVAGMLKIMGSASDRVAGAVVRPLIPVRVRPRG